MILPFRDVTLFRHLIKRVPDWRPELHTATMGALASFVATAQLYPNYGGLGGAPKGAPVSVCAGYANPAQFTTSEIGVSGGGSYPLHTEAAIMATIPTLTQPEIAIVDGQVVTSSPAVANFFPNVMTMY